MAVEARPGGELVPEGHPLLLDQHLCVCVCGGDMYTGGWVSGTDRPMYPNKTQTCLEALEGAEVGVQEQLGRGAQLRGAVPPAQGRRWNGSSQWIYVHNKSQILLSMQICANHAPVGAVHEDGGAV